MEIAFDVDWLQMLGDIGGIHCMVPLEGQHAFGDGVPETTKWFHTLLDDLGAKTKRNHQEWTRHNS